MIVTCQEIFMIQQNKGQPPKTEQTQTPPFVEANKQRQRAEEREVAGRHKNDGQKGHKGAR